MTSSASGPDSAFLPDDALPRGVPSGASSPAGGHGGHGGTQWLHHAMAIWLAPEPPVGGHRTDGLDDGDACDGLGPSGQPSPAH